VSGAKQSGVEPNRNGAEWNRHKATTEQDMSKTWCGDEADTMPLYCTHSSVWYISPIYSRHLHCGQHSICSLH